MPKGSALLSSAAPHVGHETQNRRVKQFEALIEHCTAAQIIADGEGDRFLSYMLAMTIQAARGAMR